MLGYDILYQATLVVFTFGALAFSLLTLFYWHERPRGGGVFRAFALACAAAFLINLALRAEPRWEPALNLALDLVTGMIPALMLHLVCGQRVRGLVLAFYAVSAAAAIAQCLDDSGLFSLPFRDQMPATLFGFASLTGIVFVGAGEQKLRGWYRGLLGLMLLSTAAYLIDPSPLAVLAPDYLLLALFAVTLFYRERLVFFDLLFKWGAFFGLGLVILTIGFAVARSPYPVVFALLLSPLWLLAPLVYRRLERAIDRAWLHRRYSGEEAERRFRNELQLASSENDLLRRTERTLAEVFQAPAKVHPYTAPLPAGGDCLAALLEGGGWVTVAPRASGIPYLSDDRRLMQSLARTLSVVRENVRFREEQERQKERERELRLLASRAELRALRASINPHFLFNALNAIAGLIHEQPDLADRTVERLAQVFRYTLRKSEKEWVRLDEEMELVEAYLSVEKARFGERLQVEIEMERVAAGIPVPAMTVQPLVENAIRHGASVVETGGRIGLRAAIDGKLLRVEVYDNGPGFPAGFSLADSAGHGLRNIVERLRGYYGQAAELRWECEPGSTRVLLSLPTERNESDSNSDRRG